MRSCCLLSGLGLTVALVACVGTTGGDLITFPAFAAGPADAVQGEPYALTTGRGYDVSLTRARLHISAVYMNRSVPVSVSSDTSCTLAGIYAAEVTGAIDVDVLSPTLQPFPSAGFAASERARTGEVWLTGGDVNEESDPTVILDVAGVARRGDDEYPFEGTVTISKNRVVAPSDPALPGAKPICKQRVVSPIPIDVTPRAGGRLVVRINPRGWFANVEFSKLAKVSDQPPLYRFQDSSADQPSDNLYGGLRASAGVYEFQWEEAEP